MEPDVMQKQLIYRKVVIKKLRQIFEPIPDHSSYHIVIGNHGTGKTTVVQQCARDVGKGVIYVDVPPVLDNFIDNLAKAIGYSFKEYVSYSESFKQKILGNSESAEQPRFFRVLNAFERGARKYKANNGKPPVLILDNINKLSQDNVKLLKDLQNIAKLYADQRSCIIVFVNSEGTVPRMMMQRSSWSRSDQEPIVIGDLTNNEAYIYLHEKLGIEKKVTNQLIQLLGGQIRDLKTYGNKIKNEGVTFEAIRKIVLSTINHNFHQAQMIKGERNHIIGKIIVQELVKNKKIYFDTFIELINNEQIADELLQANVFSYNPESNIITFQSQATEVFVKENPELKSREVFS
ncbi:P-loop containing nucleoside triphosphate hydrolase protein [Glomus cerebriforme]|uniref:P-loop containing nucleoside triphosphate hydrolase protein n=1 Tax=Glomus cerebriforme TaxID=658196 RepID=A0A397TJ43_9GLOM|nr:P-loop containing nucleoside triphosphate hydrolase protein [Glomus cerebriforme]